MEFPGRAGQTAARDRPRAAHRGCARHRSHRGQTDKRHEFGATRHSRFDSRRGPEEAQMKVRELVAILDRREMGRFFRDMKGRVSFVYDENWRNAVDAYPLSLSMPLTLGEHGNSKTDPFLWGLLPDNEKVLDQWGKKFQVSSRNAFGLIAGVGEDCAGAVQLVRPDRLDAILGKQPPEIEWLTPGDIAQRLRSLREDHAGWRNPGDTGQFSLAGAQPKTALLLQKGRWGIPSGRLPTTHIFEAADRPVRRSCRKRACLPDAVAQSRLARGTVENHAVWRRDRHRHRALRPAAERQQDHSCAPGGYVSGP